MPPLTAVSAADVRISDDFGLRTYLSTRCGIAGDHFTVRGGAG